MSVRKINDGDICIVTVIENMAVVNTYVFTGDDIEFRANAKFAELCLSMDKDLTIEEVAMANELGIYVTADNRFSVCIQWPWNMYVL